jgi:hypothetical protein
MNFQVMGSGYTEEKHVARLGQVSFSLMNGQRCQHFIGGHGVCEGPPGNILTQSYLLPFERDGRNLLQI